MLCLIHSTVFVSSLYSLLDTDFFDLFPPWEVKHNYLVLKYMHYCWCKLFYPVLKCNCSQNPKPIVLFCISWWGDAWLLNTELTRTPLLSEICPRCFCSFLCLKTVYGSAVIIQLHSSSFWVHLEHGKHNSSEDLFLFLCLTHSKHLQSRAFFSGVRREDAFLFICVGVSNSICIGLEVKRMLSVKCTFKRVH